LDWSGGCIRADRLRNPSRRHNPSSLSPPFRRWSRKPLRRSNAHIAGTACIPFWGFTEMGTDLQMAALGDFDKSTNLVITLPRPLLFSRVSDLVNEISQQADITFLPQQKAIRGFAVTPSASGFLVILLDRFWEGEVDD